MVESTQQNKEKSVQSLVDKLKAKEIVEPKTEEFTTAIDEEVIQFVAEKSFSQLGVCPEICSAVEKMGYKHPSKI
jgi:ATP-dependent RNA helicase DDX47/RRP3